MNSLIEGIDIFIEERLNRYKNYSLSKESYRYGDYKSLSLSIFTDYIVFYYNDINENDYFRLEKELDEFNENLIFSYNNETVHICGNSRINLFVELDVYEIVKIIKLIGSNKYFLKFIVKFIYKFYGYKPLYYFLTLILDNNKNWVRLGGTNLRVYTMFIYNQLINEKVLFELIDNEFISNLKADNFEHRLKGVGNLLPEFVNVILELSKIL